MFDSNDPRLTAYVLGELDDASRVELEAALERSPELSRAVEELRQAAEFLREALHSEPAPSLTTEQRESIRAASRRAAEEQESVGAAGASKNGSAASSPSEGLVGVKPSLATRNAPAWSLAAAGIAALLLIGVIAIGGRQGFFGDGNPSDVNAVALGEGKSSLDSKNPTATEASRSSDPSKVAMAPAEFEQLDEPAFDADMSKQFARGGADINHLAMRDGTALWSAEESGGARGDREARFYDHFYKSQGGYGAVPGGAAPPAPAGPPMASGYGAGYGGEMMGGADAARMGMGAGGFGQPGTSGGQAADFGGNQEGYGLPAPTGNAGAEGAVRLEQQAETYSFRDERVSEETFSRENTEPARQPSATATPPAAPATGLEIADADAEASRPTDRPYDPRGVENAPRTAVAPPAQNENLGARMLRPAAPATAPASAAPDDAAPLAEKTTELGDALDRAVPENAPEPAGLPPGEPASQALAKREAEPAPQAAEPVRAELQRRLSMSERTNQAGKPDEAPVADAPARPAAGDPLELAEAEGRGERPLDRLQQQGQQEMRQRGRTVAEARAKDQQTAEADENKELEEARKEEAKKNAAPVATTWRRGSATPNASKLMIGDRDELPLQGMQANVTIDGFRARVLMDLYYYNDRGQQLEGDFKLRLPDDASLYYFAFGQSSFEYRPQVDQLASRGFVPAELIRGSGTGPEAIVRVREGTWNNVKEARIVPREKAAHAYSETVRRRVDPALVEWAGAGVFNARVFPLMPGKLHRIVVGYDVNLTQDGDALAYELELPQNSSQVHVDLNLAAVPDGEATVIPNARPFTASGRAYYHFEGPWNEPLRVRINAPETIVLHGKDHGGAPFFATRVTPDLAAEENGAGSPHAIFLVDTSLSSSPDKFNVWLKLLEATLTKNRDTMKRFAVLFFNIESHWWKERYVENNEENVQELLNYCNTLALEGATDLRQALTEATAPTWAENEKPASQPDLFLLSDGAVTWGEQNLHLLAETLRSGTGGTLFAYQTGLTGTAVGVLEHLARESGGAVFSVVYEQEVEKAATAHRQRPWRLLDVAVPGGDDLLVAGRPKTIYPDQSLLVVGRGQPGNEAILRVARGDDEQTVRIPLGEAVESETAARLYGQTAVGQLESLGAAVEDVSVAYARHFRVTGQTCSLLMLDNEADYQRFNIRPEDDAFVVKSSEAGGVVANKLDELGDRLTDPKKALELWLAKMENTPGVQFRLSTAMKLALERLPAKSLAVLPPRLVVKSRGKDDLSKKYFEQLGAAQLDYDAVTEEAARRLESHGAADALRALSSLIENNPGDPTLARDVAFSAIEWGLGGQAYSLLRRVADARPYEPQVYQALGQCAAELGNGDLAIVYYEVALGGQWHERYQDFNQVAGVEYIHLLRRIDRGELSSNIPDYARARLESLVQSRGLDKADLVVTMMWNTDRTDVDLHVLEPSGEECYYKNRNTRTGGEITRDVTEGYGPEMYLARTAQHGKYVVRANYYGSDANRTELRTKVYVTIYEDFGGRKERAIKKTVALSRGKELRDVAEVFVEKQ